MNAAWHADQAAAAARNDAAESTRADYEPRRYNLHYREMADKEARTANEAVNVANAAAELELSRERVRLEAAHSAHQLEATQMATALAQEHFEAKQALRRRTAEATASDRLAADADRKRRLLIACALQTTSPLQRPCSTSPRRPLPTPGLPRSP